MKNNKKSMQWQLNENSAEAYERYLVPMMFKPWAKRLIDIVDLSEGEHLLDAACGTGIVARCGAEQLKEKARITGLDINEGMLNEAKAASKESGSSIQWQQGDIYELPFDDQTFDAVCCQQALQFFEASSAALGEMCRVLQPGGRLGIAVWRSIEYNWPYKITSEALEKHVGKEAGVMMLSPFPDWDQELLRNMIKEAGFRNIHIQIGIGPMRYPSVKEFIRREAASSPLAGPLAQLDAESLYNLVRDITKKMQNYIDSNGVTFPMETLLIYANR